MDEAQREHAEGRLARLEVVLVAMERRQEVVETLWASRDREDAVERLRALLRIPDETPPEVVLDLQFGRLTTQDRRKMAQIVVELRRELGRE